MNRLFTCDMWMAALLIGFAGSLHCLGMCSPLAMAVTGMRPSAAFNRLLYNAGRILAYALLGALISAAGYVLPLDKFQNFTAMALGIALLVIGITGVKKITIPGFSAAMQSFSTFLKSLFSRQLAMKGRASMFFSGALNGLLPCGLTVIALTWCVTLRGPLDGFNFMLLFGVGTLPVMLGVTTMLPVLLKKFNWDVQRLTAAMLIVSGCLLIARIFVVHAPHTPSASSGFVDIMLCR